MLMQQPLACKKQEGLASPGRLSIGYLSRLLRIESAKVQNEFVVNAIKSFHMSFGRCSIRHERRSHLPRRRSDRVAWNGQCLKNAGDLEDRLGQRCRYKAPVKLGFEVDSLAINGKKGGEGQDRDIP